MLLQVLSIVHILLIESTRAAVPPKIFCEGLPGCNDEPAENVIFETTIPFAVGFLLNLAGGLAVIFMVLGGAQMLLSLGDESKISKAKWSLAYAGLGLALALTSQTFVAFVATENFLAGGGDLLLGGFLPSVVRIILLLLNVTFLLIIMFAGFRMVAASGKQEEFQKSLAIIRWAIVGAIVINASRMLVQAVLHLPL